MLALSSVCAAIVVLGNNYFFIVKQNIPDFDAFNQPRKHKIYCLIDMFFLNKRRQNYKPYVQHKLSCSNVVRDESFCIMKSY